MKRKKLLSWVLTAALCLSVSVLPAMALSFPDANAVGDWAVPYIDDVVAKGIFVGIEGKFVPGKTITTSEVLATCARISVDAELRNQIGAARADQIKGLMNAEQDWFHKEYAVCLETGILTYPELKELYQSGALLKPITKEDFALYLVRAMQLEPMAKNLVSYSLDFKDLKDITPGREPYIYVLNMSSIITGTDAGTFQPKSLVNRAVAATMLSKATDYMEESGTSVELPEYSEYYDWEAGTIVTASAGNKGVLVLTLANDLSGTKTVSIPGETPVYQNSMLVDATLLKAGVYARVNMDSSGGAIDVRLSGSLQTVAGSVVGVSKDAIMVSVGGATQTLGYDRFTEVQVGTKVGDRTLIDLDAGYTNVSCRTDQLGHMVAMVLTGGTRKEEGLISSVENLTTGGTTMVVTGFDGQLQRLNVPAGATITSNGLPLAPGALTSSYAGSYVSLRVSNDDGSNVVTAALDTVTKYVQGAVKGTGTDNGVNTITLTDLANNKATTYKVAANATYAYQGTAVSYGGVLKDWFVTVRISGGELAALWGHPGSSLTEGIIASISFPTGTTKQIIGVTRVDGSVANFEFDLLTSTLPEVKRSGKASSLDKLRTGDVAKVTVRYNAVTLIDATPQGANLAGTITELSQTVSGVTIKVELDAGAGTNTYTVGGDVSITQNGKTISMYDLRVGYHVAMVSSGEKVASIEVNKTNATNNRISGTVILPGTNTERTVLFRITDGSALEATPITVSIPSGITIQDAATGASIAFSKLAPGDVLDIYGAYANDQFKATLVVRK